MTADDLQRLYIVALERLLGPDGDRYVNTRTTRWMLAEARTTTGATCEPAPGRTWIWSDLHLHHRNIIRYCQRPFASVQEMDAALLRAWRETVGTEDTIICGGDVALAGTLGKRRLNRLQQLPGHKVLVRGNHDFDRAGQPADIGNDTASMTLLVPGNPPLLVTHIALHEVPDGCVNVYGHVHDNEPLRAGPYINVCVEQTGYRPIDIDDVRRLGRRRLEDPRPLGETTQHEIAALERNHRQATRHASS